ncbi:MAG: hypothetical protein HYY17_03210 [Planctomycetes bacterium]|nr:hypothetical protein [Planctomycetota bacterium]
MKRLLPIVAGAGLIVAALAMRPGSKEGRVARVHPRSAAVAARPTERATPVADEPLAAPAAVASPDEPAADDRYEGSCDCCGLEDRSHLYR